MRDSGSTGNPTARRKPVRLARALAMLVLASASLVGVSLAMTAAPAAAEVPHYLIDGYISNLGPYGSNQCVDDLYLPLRTSGCDGTNHQIWHIGQFADLSYEFNNKATGMCLDDSPTYHLRTTLCNGGWGGYQKWRSVRPDELMNEATGLCLDYSPDNGLRTFGCNGGWGGYQDWLWG